MDTFNFTLLLTFAAGVILIMYSAYNFYGTDDEDKYDESDYTGNNIENKIKAIDTSVADADNVIGELSDISSSVFKELDDKYQELLFLYNLVDEKKKELLGAGVKNESIMNDSAKGINILVNDAVVPVYKNPKLKKIAELESSGKSVGEIAKELGMGQGEVSLIMELGKGR